VLIAELPSTAARKVDTPLTSIEMIEEVGMSNVKASAALNEIRMDSVTDAKVIVITTLITNTLIAVGAAVGTAVNVKLG
jgi:hypothetical protein